MMGAFQIIILKKTAKEAFKPFEKEVFTDFRDAMRGACTYKCTVKDFQKFYKICHCLDAIERAIKIGWYNSATFNVTEYQQYEKIENGDLNWIIPKKFLAFSTPVDDTRAAQEFSFTPDFFVPIFKKLGVTMVVRLNNKEYDQSVFF